MESASSGNRGRYGTRSLRAWGAARGLDYLETDSAVDSKHVGIEGVSRYGIPEKGDANWLDHQGSYMAAIAAGPVFRLLGAKDLGVSNDYMKEMMPAVNVGMLNGELAWRQHDGGHTDTPNISHFVAWAKKKFQ